MFKFRGFRASLNLSGGGKKQQDAYEYSFVSENMSINGAYRSNREEFFGTGSLSGERKTITPSMIKLPQSFDPEPLRPAKSTGNLTQSLPANLTKSTPDVSMNPKGAAEPEPPKRTAKTKDKQKADKQRAEKQKQLEKQRAAEHKKREKEAAAEKKRIEKENKTKKAKAPKTPAASAPQGNIPLPPPMPQANPLSQNRNNAGNRDTTISKTSGPPPYEEVPNKLEVLPNTRDNGNTSFSKPIDSASSWDLVSQHREQLRTPTEPERRQKTMVMDLNYNINKTRDNSEA